MKESMNESMSSRSMVDGRSVDRLVNESVGRRSSIVGRRSSVVGRLVNRLVGQGNNIRRVVLYVIMQQFCIIYTLYYHCGT